MSYMLENYVKSKAYMNKYDSVIEDVKYRKFKYPSIYMNQNDKCYAVANISYPSTTEIMADYLSKDSKYVIVHHEKLGRDILLLSHEGRYYHEFDKINSFLVVAVSLEDELKKVVFNLEDFLAKDKENNEYKFVENNL